MTIQLIIGILLIHYLFDWLFQSRHIAENKSKSVKVLSQHVAIYGIGLLILALIFKISFGWVILNTLLHWVVDYITSRTSRTLWTQGKQKQFWNVIGLDQCLHYIILFSTL